MKEGEICKRLPTEAKRTRRLKYHRSRKEESKSVETGKMRTKKTLPQYMRGGRGD